MDGAVCIEADAQVAVVLGGEPRTKDIGKHPNRDRRALVEVEVTSTLVVEEQYKITQLIVSNVITLETITNVHLAVIPRDSA